MDDNLQTLGIIDLISERHQLLRRIMEERWNETSGIYISNSEWYILSAVYEHSCTIASVAKTVNITRQGTHKFIKSMQQKGLVHVFDSSHNKKEKCIELTQLGIACYEQYELLKKQLQQQITSIIGEEQLKIIKEALAKDWQIQLNVDSIENLA